MRLVSCAPMLAATFALAGAAAPVASGHQMASGGGGPNVGASGPQQTAFVQHHSGDTIDWLIGIGTAGGLAVIGTGLAAKRHRGRGSERAEVTPAA